MTAACTHDVAAQLGLSPQHLAAVLHDRLDALLDVLQAPANARSRHLGSAHVDLDVLAEFVAAARLDLPIPNLPAPTVGAHA